MILPDQYPFDEVTITAPDESGSAKFISLGATLTEFWVKDKNGIFRDIVLGYDDKTQWLTDPNHPLFGPIVGRYANRIKKGTFTIPISRDPPSSGPNVFRIPTNDHDGAGTLHGGLVGWDRKSWVLVAQTRNSVTYAHVDEADEGFPGTVTTHVTYTLLSGPVWETTVHATATEETPIMLTSHVYWNLDAFHESEDVLQHRFQVASSRFLKVDKDQLPTGELVDVEGTVYDFRKEHSFGERWDELRKVCTGRLGYDNDYVYDKTDSSDKPLMTVWGPNTGIKMEVINTNQPTVQMYTGNWLGANPRKRVHGGPTLNYAQWSGLAIEQQGYVDAINNPEWKQDHIYGPTRDFHWTSSYKFSIVP